jgi:hypothetical protein
VIPIRIENPRYALISSSFVLQSGTGPLGLEVVRQVPVTLSGDMPDEVRSEEPQEHIGWVSSDLCCWPNVSLEGLNNYVTECA